MEASETPEEDILAKFTREYKETIPLKIQTITDLLDRLKVKIDLETLKELRMHIHKIAGSAGTYGFKAVSEQCRAFEKELIEKVEHFEEHPGDPAWIKGFEESFANIKTAFTAQDIAAH